MRRRSLASRHDQNVPRRSSGYQNRSDAARPPPDSDVLDDVRRQRRSDTLTHAGTKGQGGQAMEILQEVWNVLGLLSRPCTACVSVCALLQALPDVSSPTSSPLQNLPPSCPRASHTRSECLRLCLLVFQIVIPFFSLLIKDIYFLNEGCSSRLPDGHVNFEVSFQLVRSRFPKTRRIKGNKRNGQVNLPVCSRRL